MCLGKTTISWSARFYEALQAAGNVQFLFVSPRADSFSLHLGEDGVLGYYDRVGSLFSSLDCRHAVFDWEAMVDVFSTRGPLWPARSVFIVVVKRFSRCEERAIFVEQDLCSSVCGDDFLVCVGAVRFSQL